MKNFNRIICLLLFVSGSFGFHASSQEIPVYYHSQYLLNPYLINPAIAGSKDFSILTLSARQNVERIAGAPKTQILSFHTRIRNYRGMKEGILKRGSEFSNIGVGGYVYNDASGPLRKVGFQATYAYHVPLSKESIRHLAFGLSFNGFIYSLNYGELNILRDPLIDEGTQNAFVPDANFGMYYYGESVYVGISASQLFETSITWSSDNYSSIPINRNFFLLAGYKFLINNKILIEPSLLIKSDQNDLEEFYKHLDFNLKVYYATFFVAASYRMDQGIAVLGQYQFRNFFIGLAYEYPISEIWDYNYGTAEVVLGLNIGQGINRFGDSRYW